ncbi:DNA-binding protein YbiB [Ramlibacter sp. PS4R-6]|uniref:DNA-binding protein YbiB n=1 Tax=Ramlibacter sp. PS4R-6 TaxID=3133438 RepID=UPI003099DFBD
MGISQYIREIGRGKDGARALGRVQARDLFGQVLDGSVTDLELGAFCIAMRVKGETPEEMAGFLEATYERMTRIPAGPAPLVVLPSYNGARKLPLLTPLLALLVAREGLPVLIHGAQTEGTRVFVSHVLEALDIKPSSQVHAIAPGELAYVPTHVLSPGLQRLLEVRRTVGLRNSSHSLVKLMNPSAGEAIVVGSYTHPEYAVSMGEVYELMGSTALLLRGTEGEPVADPRRVRKLEGFLRGKRRLLEEDQPGTVTELPDLPADTAPHTTAAYIRDLLSGKRPVPAPITLQVEHILRLAKASQEQETRP